MVEKIEEHKHLKQVVDTLLLSLGIIFNGIGAGVFQLPYNFLCGGATGLGRCISHVTGMPVSYAVSIVAAVFFLIGLIFLGFRFAGTIILGTVLFPLSLNVIEHIPALSYVTDNKMLAAAFGSIFIGLGIGIVIRVGGSTGGSDAIAIVLNRKLGWNTAVVLNVIDVAAILLQCTFATIEDVLFGVLIIIGYTLIINKVLLMGSSDAQFVIVSLKCENIKEKLLDEQVGITILHGKRGFTDVEQEVLICTVSRRRIRKVREIVLNQDPTAFMTILPASDVRGRGFSLERINMPRH